MQLVKRMKWGYMYWPEKMSKTCKFLNSKGQKSSCFCKHAKKTNTYMYILYVYESPLPRSENLLTNL